MSDENKEEDRGSVVDDLVLSAAVCAPAIVAGAVLGPLGFICGAASTAVALAIGDNGLPRRPDTSDPA